MSEKLVFYQVINCLLILMQPHLYTWWHLSQIVKRWLVKSTHTLKYSQTYGRDSLVIFMLQVEAVLLISFKNLYIQHYYSQAYVKVQRKSEKHKKNVKGAGKSSRQLSKSWRTMLLLRTSKYHPARYSYVQVTVAKKFLQENLNFSVYYAQ